MSENPSENKKKLIEEFAKRKANRPPDWKPVDLEEGFKEWNKWIDRRIIEDVGRTPEFVMEYLGEPFVPDTSQQNACRALHEYHAAPDMLKKLHVMQYIAYKHSTTIPEMKEHWRCVNSGRKCYVDEITSRDCEEDY